MDRERDKEITIQYETLRATQGGTESERDKQFYFSSYVCVCVRVREPEQVWVRLSVCECEREREIYFLVCERCAAYVSPSVRCSDTPQISHITYMEKSARLMKKSRFYYACDAVRVLLIAHVSI